MLIPVGIKENIFSSFSQNIQEHLRNIAIDTATSNKEVVSEEIKKSGVKTKSGKLLDSISVIPGNNYEAYIDIDADYASYLDEGFAPYDMRKGLLNGPKSKISKDGYRYNRIPIGDHVVTISERSQKKAWGQRNVYGQFMKTWTHPGIKGYNFSLGIQSRLNQMIVTNMKEYIEEIMLEGK